MMRQDLELELDFLNLHHFAVEAPIIPILSYLEQEIEWELVIKNSFVSSKVQQSIILNNLNGVLKKQN